VPGPRSVTASLAEVARRLKPAVRRPDARARPDTDRLSGFGSRSGIGSGPGSSPRLLLMTDSVRLPDPERAVGALPRGSGVVLRERDGERRRALAVRLAPLCRRRRVRLLIAGDWRLAVAAGADGVHLSEAAARGEPRRWQAVRRRGMRVTAAAHSPRAIRRAAALGLDGVLLSPVAPTDSHPTGSHPSARPLGPLRFARWAHEAPLPVYALGGIDARTALRLLPARPAGFAAIGALSASAVPDGGGRSSLRS